VLGLNRGFGFVTLRNEEDAHKVREKLKYVDGKLINIKSAKPNGRFGKTDRNDNNSNNIIITTTNNNGDTMNVQNEGNESETERPVERVVVRDEDESKMDDAGSGDEGVSTFLIRYPFAHVFVSLKAMVMDYMFSTSQSSTLRPTRAPSSTLCARLPSPRRSASSSISRPVLLFLLSRD